jgi:nucleotide-binding universal stress UspA family protein
VKQCVDLARRADAEVVLVHIGAIPEDPVGLPDAMASVAQVYQTELKQKLRKDRERLEELRERYIGQGARVSNMIREGFPDTSLVEAAEELGADLLAVGTHGATGLKRVLLGSVAERVVRLFTSRVLVARPRHEFSGGYRRILVPTDFGEGSDRVLDSALAMAADGGDVRLVYCWHLPLMASSYYAPVASHEKLVGPLKEGIIEAAEERADKLRAAHPNTNISFEAVEAPPIYGIQEQAEKFDADLIVMGSHGRRGIRRWILGSVAEVTVRHAPCSVLVVHGEE